MANKKNKANNNIKTITSTAKKVNAEVQETANYVVNDLAENGQQLKDNAIKAVEGVKLADSAEKIKKSAKKVNAQIKNAASTISENTAERAEEMIEKIDLKGGYQKVKNTVSEVNAYSLDTTKELLEMAKSNNEEWAKLMNKAIDGGLKLGNRQQAMMFDALENVKAQFLANANRFTSIMTRKAK